MSLIRKHGAVLQAWACLDLVFPACNCRPTSQTVRLLTARQSWLKTGTTLLATKLAGR